MFDINQLLQGIQQNPQFLDRAAESLAMNPQMQPPAPGSMSQAMQSLMQGVPQGGPQLGPGGLTPPQLPGAPPPATPPITPGTQVANPGGPAPLPDGLSLGAILGAGQGQVPLTGQQPQPGMDPQAMQRAMAALEPAREHKDPSFPQQPFISNLALGAAGQAQGLRMPGRQVPQVGGLGQYL